MLNKEVARTLGKYLSPNSPTSWNKGKPLVFTVEEICKAANNFYKKAWEFEYSKFYQNNPATYNFGPWDEIDKKVQDIGKDHPHEFLLRIGRFSHAEAVTLEDYRRLPKGHGNSRTLFSYKNWLYPMGWVVARVEEQEHA